MTTDLQKQARAAIDAKQAEEDAAAADLQRRVSENAESMAQERQVREAAVAAQQAETLAALQQKAADDKEGLLKAQARQAWRGSPTEFDEIWPTLRQQLLAQDVVNQMNTRPKLTL